MLHILNIHSFEFITKNKLGGSNVRGKITVLTMLFLSNNTE